MKKKSETGKMERVTPFAGVWIEITMLDEVYKLASSLPSRECGLKFQEK